MAENRNTTGQLLTMESGQSYRDRLKAEIQAQQRRLEALRQRTGPMDMDPAEVQNIRSQFAEEQRTFEALQSATAQGQASGQLTPTDRAFLDTDLMTNRNQLSGVGQHVDRLTARHSAFGQAARPYVDAAVDAAVGRYLRLFRLGRQLGVHVRRNRRLRCGDYGPYGMLRRRRGGGQLDRDHVPSSEALKQRARMLSPGRQLSAAQERAIERTALTIAIPSGAHQRISPTYGQRAANPALDAQDLQGAARRDVQAMLRRIAEYDPDGSCRREYQRAAARVLRITNAEYDARLMTILQTVR